MWLNSSRTVNFCRDTTSIAGIGPEGLVEAFLSWQRQTYNPQDIERDATELVVVELIKSNSKSVYLYTFYCPPNSTPDVLHELNSALQDTIESCQIILVGDFNFPAIDWTIDPNAPINSGGRVDDDIFCHLVGDDQDLPTSLL